jgi:K+/H+ antiporter YhaU regulatory subunit KhtT
MNDLVNLLRQVILDQSLGRIIITRGIVALLTMGAISLRAQAATVVILDKCCETTLSYKSTNQDYAGKYRIQVKVIWDSVTKERTITITQIEGPVKRTELSSASITEDAEFEPNPQTPIMFGGDSLLTIGNRTDIAVIQNGSFNNGIL